MAITHSKVSTKPDGTDPTLVLPSDWNDDHDGTLAHGSLTGLTSGDDHTQYQKESEKGAASGYAALDSGILVPIAQLPTGTGASQVALGNHTHSGAPPTGSAGGDLSGTYPNPSVVDDSHNHTASTGGGAGGTPAVVLGSAVAAGAATSFLRTDDTIAAFDATAPTTQAYSDSPAVGSAAFAARRDHKHGMPATSAGGGTGIYGDGSDGTVAFDGTNTFAAFATTTGSAPNRVYTLIRDVSATNMTVSSGKTVIAGGFRIFCTGTLTNSGTIHNDGAAAVTSTGGAGAGVAGSTLGRGATGGVAPTSGTNTTSGSSGNTSGTGTSAHALGGIGGAGGGANPGASGGTNPIPAANTFRDAVSAISQMSYFVGAVANNAPTLYGTAGGGGGGGGGRTTGGTATVGGAGGGGGGVLVIVANGITNTSGIISANGGNGANASGAGTCVTGGGGGGGGGAVFLVFNTLAAGTETANGGTKGTGLNGSSAASDGAAGVVVKIANA